MSSEEGSACSGDMYVGVPTMPRSVAQALVGQVELGGLGDAEVDDLGRGPAVVPR